VWIRAAALRPVPLYAKLPASALEGVEHDLAGEPDQARADLDEAFQRFETSQPHVADRMAKLLDRPLDDTARALGYFLSIAVWLAFERTFGARLEQASADGVDATATALKLEEELRASSGDQPLDLDDIVAIEQPAILAFLNEHVDAALDPTVGESDVDVDDVHAVFREILVLALALSHAVAPESGATGGGGELLA
jgi:ABC-type uncharacterized transport system ATPase component